MADDRDMMAAEYVLGTLPEEERTAAAERVASDPAFAALVRAWEDRLAPLDRETPPMTPSERVWRRIEAAVATEIVVPRGGPRARLVDAAGPVADVIDITRRLRRWRVLAVAATVVAASLAGLIVVDRMPELLRFVTPDQAVATWRWSTAMLRCRP